MMMLEVVDMEADKVSDKVSATWWHIGPTLLVWPWWVKIPTEYITDVTLVIGDTYDVRGGDMGAGGGHGGWHDGW